MRIDGYNVVMQYPTEEYTGGQTVPKNLAASVEALFVREDYWTPDITAGHQAKKGV
jgi:hypothetical protein